MIKLKTNKTFKKSQEKKSKEKKGLKLKYQ